MQALISVYAIAVLAAVATTFFRPIVQAMMPALVKKDELLAANSIPPTWQKPCFELPAR